MNEETTTTSLGGEYCLAFVQMYDTVILAMKKTGIGKGLLNGYGGKIESYDLSIMTALIRECRAEAGIEVLHIPDMKVAEVICHTHEIDGIVTAKIHVFKVQKYNGDLKETAEMGAPEFFRSDRGLPFDRMMPGDTWVSLILFPKNKKIRAIVHYGPEQKELWGADPIQITEVSGFDF